MAEIGLAASIIAVIQIAASVTTQACNYGVKFKNAKKDLDGVNRELGRGGGAIWEGLEYMASFGSA